jgi:hypothetical protein
MVVGGDFSAISEVTSLAAMAGKQQDRKDRVRARVESHELRSVAESVLALLFGIFLVLFTAALLPWLLAGAVTAAAESLMHRVGFDSYDASTLWDWSLVFIVGLGLVIFLAIVVVTIIWLYNFLVRRSGMGQAALTSASPWRKQLPAGTAPAALPAPTGPNSASSYEALYAEAQQRGIEGRSRMTKAQLKRALARSTSR